MLKNHFDTTNLLSNISETASYLKNAVHPHGLWEINQSRLSQYVLKEKFHCFFATEGFMHYQEPGGKCGCKDPWEK